MKCRSWIGQAENYLKTQIKKKKLNQDRFLCLILSCSPCGTQADWERPEMQSKLDQN